MHQCTYRFALFFCFTFSLAVLANVAQAQNLTVLHNFTGGNDGALPASSLITDRAGNLYGTTTEGGAHNYGTVFRMSHAGSGWILTTLYSFDGMNGNADPNGGLAFGPDGSLYGTLCCGLSDGGIYRLRPAPTTCHSVSCPWEETIIHMFTGGLDGGDPSGNLVVDQAGNIYGTSGGGGTGMAGLIYEFSPSNGGWTETVLYNFTVETGYLPNGGVIFDNAGNLYGATSLGGPSGGGAVFELSPSGSGWTLTNLATSSFPGAEFTGGVAMDAQGNLFGGACCGRGYERPGGIFELTPSNGGWTLNPLYAFNVAGTGPQFGVVLNAADDVYGVSVGTGQYSLGEVYKLTDSNGSWNYTSVSFNGSNGEQPRGGVILDSAGTIYGTAWGGGTGSCNVYGSNGCGVVWAITQ